MSVFTSNELAALTGADHDQATFTLLHELAVGIVEAECGRTWSTDPDPVTSIRKVDSDGRVTLPRPVASVDTVRVIDLTGQPGATVAGWQFDGIATIRLAPAYQILNLPADYADGYGDTIQVTYTPAAKPAPAAVKAVALALAGRIHANPSGASSLSIDDYRQGWTGGGGVALLPAERAVLARYRARGLSSQATVAVP